MRIVFFGTPAYAVPSLERLLDGPHRVVGTVSQPDRPRGRGRKTVPAPVAERALAHGVPALRPAAVGQFIPRRVRELPRSGYCINGHASLLPRWRGAAPIQRAILAGDAETGVCVMRVEREMDAGPVAARTALAIGADETAGELSERMAAATAQLLAEVVDGVAAGDVAWEPQPLEGITLAPKLERNESELDFREPAAALARCVRAFAPEPGARARLDDEPLRILSARALDAPCTAPPGSVEREGDALRVATGSGWLELLALQRPGKRALDAAAFLRGRPVGEGARFALPGTDGPRDAVASEAGSVD